MFNGILSHKLRNHTHLGVIYCLLPIFSTRTYFAFTNAIVPSKESGQPINAHQDIFLQVVSLNLTGRVEVPYDKYLHIPQ